MRFIAMVVIAMSGVSLANPADAVIYECLTQFGDKVFSNVPPEKIRWICTDSTTSPTIRKTFFEKQNDECVPAVLTCRIVDATPSVLDGKYVSLTCVIENAVADEARGAPISVKYNEGNNMAVVNDQAATHVSITDTTLQFQWGGDVKNNLRIDRLSGRFQAGNAQFSLLATGRCDRASERRF